PSGSTRTSTSTSPTRCSASATTRAKSSTSTGSVSAGRASPRPTTLTSASTSAQRLAVGGVKRSLHPRALCRLPIPREVPNDLHDPPAPAPDAPHPPGDLHDHLPARLGPARQRRDER